MHYRIEFVSVCLECISQPHAQSSSQSALEKPEGRGISLLFTFPPDVDPISRMSPFCFVYSVTYRTLF